MSQKFSAGPWRIETSDCDHVVVVAADSSIVATLPLDDEGKYCEADAALIISALELREMLQFLYEQFPLEDIRDDVESLLNKTGGLK